MTQADQDKTAKPAPAPGTVRQAEQTQPGRTPQRQSGDDGHGSMQQGGMGDAPVRFNDWASI